MNKTLHIGRLTRDPELRKTSTGKSVTNVTIAVDKPKKDSDPDFITAQVWGTQAENLCKYTSKGRLIAIEGHISSGSYKDKEGKTIYTQDLVADRVEFLGAGGQKKPEEKSSAVEDSFEQIAEDIPF